MAACGFAGPAKQYAGKMTPYVFFICLIAATGGLIFGYDIGISGVTSGDPFLSKFFPSVYHMIEDSTGTNHYCSFNRGNLTLFRSSLYLAALVGSFLASWTTSKFGRKISMLMGGLVFLAGTAINGAAKDVVMLIIGRLLRGVGIGFANQSVPLYLSEMAPANYRGFLNIFFQHMITIGIAAGNLINYGGWGWRVCLAGAAVPAAIFTIGSLFLPDTPNSLIERHPNNPEKAQAILRHIRGTDDVEEEYSDLLAAGIRSNKIDYPWRNILNRRYRPQLVMSILIPFFQQLTGMNVIMFYGPVLFRTIGLGEGEYLINAANYVYATLVIAFAVDKMGRRGLFLFYGSQMFFYQIALGTLIGLKFGATGVAQISQWYAVLVFFFICMNVSAFACSWGPLGWLVPSEIFPLEIRSVGQSINVSVNMLFTFLIAQAFPKMLCHMKFGLFYFFAFWVLCMTVFVYFFLPETKNVPIEDVFLVWKRHWFWGKFIHDNDILDGLEKRAAEDA